MNNLLDYIRSIFGDGEPSSGVLNFFYSQLYSDFSPDINGYVLAFFIPPDLSGYRIENGKDLYDQAAGGGSYFGKVANLITFAAIDFTPPQNQVNTEQISSRSGAIPYATEVTESEQCTITLVDNSNLDIYMFHHIWVEYMREVLEGVIEPAPEYITPGEANFGAIDYVGSLYVVKYRPDMQTITFAAKCIGIFPQGMPAKELIGSRTTNEMTTLPFTYFCASYREATYLDQDSNGGDNWILQELDKFIFSKFQSTSNTNQLTATGDSLGGLIPNLGGTNLSSFGQGRSSIGGAIGGIIGAAGGIISSAAGLVNRGASLYNQGQSIVNSMGQMVRHNFNSAGQMISVITTITTQSRSIINKIPGNAPKFY